MNWTSHIAIYVRSSGDDSNSGLDESLAVATAQRAFEIAHAATEDCVLNLGAGSFGGVNLQNAGASSWPARIGVRGAGSGASNLGGIDAKGIQGIYDYNDELEDYVMVSPTPGKNVTILSDQSANLGSIECNGGGIFQLEAFGSFGQSGGAIHLTGCVVFGLSNSGGNSEYSAGSSAGSAGPITLTNCICNGAMSAAGGYGDEAQAGSGGTIIATDCRLVAAYSNGGSAGGWMGYAAGGAGGSITLTRCILTDPNAYITSQSGDGPYTGSPGAISLTDCRFTSGGSPLVRADSGSMSDLNFALNPAAQITLAGDTWPIPRCFGNVLTTQLRQGRGVNGSAILAIL